MSLKLLLACLYMSFMLVACATGDTQSEAERAANAPPKDDIVCRRQRPVGSYVPVNVCRKREDADADRKEAQRVMGPLRPMSGDMQRMPGDDPVGPPR